MHVFFGTRPSERCKLFCSPVMANLVGLKAHHVLKDRLPLHCRPAERPGERIYFRFNDVAAGQQQLLALNAEVSFQMAPDPYDNADRASKLQVMTKQFDPSRLKMQGGEKGLAATSGLLVACHSKQGVRAPGALA